MFPALRSESTGPPPPARAAARPDDRRRQITNTIAPPASSRISTTGAPNPPASSAAPAAVLGVRASLAGGDGDLGRRVRRQVVGVPRLALLGRDLPVEGVELLPDVSVLAGEALGLGAPLLVPGVVLVVVEEVAVAGTRQVVEQEPQEEPVPDAEAGPRAVGVVRRRPAAAAEPARAVPGAGAVAAVAAAPAVVAARAASVRPRRVGRCRRREAGRLRLPRRGLLVAVPSQGVGGLLAREGAVAGGRAGGRGQAGGVARGGPVGPAVAAAGRGRPHRGASSPERRGARRRSAGSRVAAARAGAGLRLAGQRGDEDAAAAIAATGSAGPGGTGRERSRPSRHARSLRPILPESMALVRCAKGRGRPRQLYQRPTTGIRSLGGSRPRRARSEVARAAGRSGRLPSGKLAGRPRRGRSAVPGASPAAGEDSRVRLDRSLTADPATPAAQRPLGFRTAEIGQSSKRKIRG